MDAFIEIDKITRAGWKIVFSKDRVELIKSDDEYDHMEFSTLEELIIYYERTSITVHEFMKKWRAMCFEYMEVWPDLSCTVNFHPTNKQPENFTEITDFVK